MPASFETVLWLYVAVATIGVVMIVPTILRAVDNLPGDVVTGSIAFAATVFGVVGIIASQFDSNWATNLVASTAIGLAAGAVHPEILSALREPAEPPDEIGEPEAIAFEPPASAQPVTDTAADSATSELPHRRHRAFGAELGDELS